VAVDVLIALCAAGLILAAFIVMPSKLAEEPAPPVEVLRLTAPDCAISVGPAPSPSVAGFQSSRRGAPAAPEGK
jgi:hypothetical protein